MNRAIAIPLTLAALLTAAGAAVHHGWSEYDSQRTLNLVGTVQNVRFSNPHVMIDLRVTTPQARSWDAVLAPPARMRTRGLPQESLRTGMTARVIGHPHKEHANEMRALRIVIANDTTELR